jgi:hypothetical protein
VVLLLGLKGFDGQQNEEVVELQENLIWQAPPREFSRSTTRASIADTKSDTARPTLVDASGHAFVAFLRNICIVEQI